MNYVAANESLRIKLAIAADLQEEKSTEEGNYLAKLLEDAGNELEEAIGLLDESGFIQAKLFLSRHAVAKDGLSGDERDLLHQALTGSNGCSVYRNYLYFDKGNMYMHAVESLLLRGFLIRGRKVGSGSYFHCTMSGAQVIGFSLPISPSTNSPENTK